MYFTKQSHGFLVKKKIESIMSLYIAIGGISTLELVTVGAWQKKNYKQSMCETQLVDNNQFTPYFTKNEDFGFRITWDSLRFLQVGQNHYR